MKKHYFNVIAALALVCGVFAFTGCADYESDINSLNERIDNLETGQIADIEDQISSMNDAITQANDLISILQGDVTSLKEADDLMNQQIDALNGLIEDIQGDITEISGKITELESDVNSNTEDIQALKDELAEKTQELADLTSRVVELEGAVETLEQLTAGLPELEQTVAEIEENYLSKTEAADTYATIESVLALQEQLGLVEGRLESLEALNIGERLAALEDNYDNLTNVVIQGLNEAITKAQTTADNAQAAADAAQEFAEGVLGQLNELKNALGVYAEAGKLEAKMDELDAMDSTLKAKDEELAKLIENLRDDVTAEMDTLRSNIDVLREDMKSAIADLESTKLDKEEFSSYFANELVAELAKNDGVLNQAIANAVKEASDILQASIDAVNKRIDDEIKPAIEDLKSRLDDAVEDIEDLEDRIQSLVFVPEYNDGKATVLSYTINDVAVSDNMVVTATFQVTPAALAENVINQYEDNVFAYVLPVLTRSSSDIAYIASAANSSLVLQKGKRDGFIDAEITVPVKTEDGVELTPGGFAISLYVASKEEVDAIVSGEETVVDMDAGTYVTSDYIQTAGKVTALDNAYVLYNEKAEREYPTSADDSENEVNYYERAWSVLNRAVSFYGDNNYDDVDDGSYTLHIKLDGEYYTLEEAAAMFRADVADITPGYDYIAQYYDRFDMASQELAEYFTVNEEDPYGLSVDMAKESAMTNVIGSYVFAMNTFSFDNDSRYGNLTVLDNVGRYKVINLPININIDADRVDWTYDFALAHADDSDNPTEPNFQPITNTLQYTAENLGEMSLADILTLTPASTEVRLGDSEEPIATDAPVITFGDVASDTDSTGTIGISVNGYDFSSETENVYHFTNTYYLEDYQVNCTVNFTLTLGTMPGDQFVNYNQLPRDIQFMLPGSGDTDIIGIDNGYSLAFKQLNKLNPEWFADEAQLTASMQMNDLTTYSSYVDGTALYEGVQHTEQSQVYTRLSVEPTAEYADGSFVRVSSSQIAAVGNVFDFITEVDTWYGVTYTFTNEGKVGAPEFELSYIPTHIYDLNGEQPYVQLDYHLNANGSAYVIDEANLRNYFNVTDIPDGFNGHLTVEFEVLTQENPAEGYANVPSIPVLNVNNTTGALGEYTINWTRYTARDLQIRATLVAAANELTSEKISLNSLDLGIRVYPLVENAEMKGADDVDYFGNNLVMDDEGYIVVNRESNETVTIKLWEYVNAYARFSNGENFIPYENAQGSRHESLVYVNQNQAMKLYGAELVLDDNYDAMSGDIRREIEYSSTNGTVIYRAEDGEIANPIYITVEGHLNYYLDYNHVGSYPVTVKIKLQDAE